MQEGQPTLSLGTIVQERYVVEAVLGKDNAGALYLVRDQRNQRHLFALKEVVNLRGRELYRYTFESTKLQRLDHPALPHVYQIFKDEQDRVYILMEYIEGPNLEVMRLQQPEHRFLLSQIIPPLSSIMEAVSYLHSQQPPMIHQNIKPSTIIETKAGTSAVLVGFGHEKVYDVEETITIIRRATSSYGAPEQYVGITTPRTDIYALGATLYTLLTGIVPPNALSRVKKLSSKESDPLVSVNQLTPTAPAPLAEAIHRAMSINSNDRFSTMEQFWGAVRQASNTIALEQQTTEHLAAIPNRKHTELDSNPTEQKAVEPVVEIEKVPSLNRDILTPGISDLPDTPTSEEVKNPITSPLQEPVKASRFKKHGMLFLTLFAALITLLGSIGVGASLWIDITSQHPPLVTFPPSAPQSGQTAPLPSPTSRASSTLVPSPNIATQYTGTLHDIPTGTTTNISLTRIQQLQGNISGYFGGMPTNGILNGIPQNGPFTGTISTAKQIHFIVTSDTGQASFSFDGMIQPDGTIAGTYWQLRGDYRKMQRLRHLEHFSSCDMT